MIRTIILCTFISSLTLNASDMAESGGADERLVEESLGKRQKETEKAKENSPAPKRAKLEKSNDPWDPDMVEDFSRILPDAGLDEDFFAPTPVVIAEARETVVVVKDAESRLKILKKLLSGFSDVPVDSALDIIAHQLLESFGLTSINSLRSILQKFAKKTRIEHADALQKYLRSDARQRAVKEGLCRISDEPSAPEVALVRDKDKRLKILQQELATLVEGFNDKALDEIAQSLSKRFGLRLPGLCKALETLKRNDRKKYDAIAHLEALKTYLKSKPRQQAVITNIPLQKISEIDRLPMIVEALNSLETPLDHATDREAELKKIADSLINKTGLKLNGLRGVLEGIKRNAPEMYNETPYIQELYSYVCRARFKK